MALNSLEKCTVREEAETECKGFSNFFESLLVFAQSFGLGSAECTLLGPPDPSYLSQVRLENNSVTGIQHSTKDESQTRASTEYNHRHLAVGATAYTLLGLPAPNDLTQVRLEYGNISDIQHSTDGKPLSCVFTENSHWQQSIQDATTYVCSFPENQQTIEIKSWAKSSTRLFIAPSIIAQNHSTELSLGYITTPYTATKKHHASCLQSDCKRRKTANNERNVDLSEKERPPNHPEGRGSAESSPSATTTHIDLELVSTSTGSSPSVRICGPDLFSMFSAAKKTEQHKDLLVNVKNSI